MIERELVRIDHHRELFDPARRDTELDEPPPRRLREHEHAIDRPVEPADELARTRRARSGYDM